MAESGGPQSNAPLRSISPPSDMENEQERDEVHAILEASASGDACVVHRLFSAWFARQRPDPQTGYLGHKKFWRALDLAIDNDRPAVLGYFLSHGWEIRDDIIARTTRSKSTRCLQILHDHGWIINEPESYCEPPYLRYIPPIIRHRYVDLRMYLYAIE